MKIAIQNINLYKNELCELEKELQDSPAGQLHTNGTSYKQRIKKKDVGIAHNEALIQKLCRKKFIIARIKQLKHNISILSSNLHEFDFTTPQEMIKNLPAAYQGLPQAYFYHPSIKPWMEKSFQPNTYPIESGWSYSNNGTPLRSKSETFIANMLEKYSLPYQYDVAIRLGDKKIYPDFLIKNPYNGKTMIWEHFGALHDSNYEKKMNEKMSHYLDNGLIPQETIIYTFESDAKRPERLQHLIEKLIL